LKTDVIKKRNRGSGNAPPVGSAATRASKKASRKNSMQQTPVSTPNSGLTFSETNSQSPPSVPGSANSGSAATTPTSFPPGTTGGKPGVVPIAAAPPKPPIQAAPAPNRSLQMTPKRQRRQSRASTNALPTLSTSQTPASAAETDMAGKPVQAPVTRAKAASMSMTAGATTMATVLQSAGMMNGNTSSHHASSTAPHGGSQEWEWLTMSL